MSEASERAYLQYLPEVGSVEGTGEWFTVDQARIDAFAEATLDFALIHVDPEAAKDGPFGQTIAHGFLTLSLLPHLTQKITDAEERKVGATGGVNYGFNKVRFVSPVRVGSRLRATVTLSGVELKGDQLEISREIVVEIEGVDRPALIAEWVIRTFY
jgi:acyl dehydratase